MEHEQSCPRCGAPLVAGAVACGQCGLPRSPGAVAPGAFPPGGFAPPPVGPPPGAVPSIPSVQQAYLRGGPMGRSGGAPVDHPDGTVVLVLGILSLVVCSILGPFAWSKGNKALRQIDRDPSRYRNRGTVQAGRILGIVTSFLLALSILAGVAAAVIVFATGGTVSTTSDSQACQTEQRTIETAAQAWQAQYGTPPTSMDDLTGPQGFLRQDTGNFRLVPSSSGGVPEVVAVEGGDCD